MTLVTFAAVLWNLSSGFVLPVFGGVTVPGYMMWAAILYALVGSWATYVIGRPLVGVNFALERYNADFRYRMVRIRENAESIALYHGEPVEERRLRGAFTRIYATWWSYMKYNKRLTWLTSFYGQAATIFPFIVAAPQYFAGQIQLGTLTQTADAFGQVQGSLSWFVDTYTQLAAWQAAVNRLTTFGDAMVAGQACRGAERVRHPPAARSPSSSSTAWRCSCRTARRCCSGVDVTVREGEAVVLRGPSGSGKTTLFRVLAGLWPFGRGRIATPPADARVLFLPQKPYLPIGTLKDALCYPDPPDQVADRDCREALEACGLWHLAPRLGEATNWSLVLSGGEQQRLGFARALLLRPDWLFLDEATVGPRRAGGAAHVRVAAAASAAHDRGQHRPPARRGGLPRPPARHRSCKPARAERGGGGLTWAGQASSCHAGRGRQAESRDPYVDGPQLARVWQGVRRIACDHMSGLLSRPHMTAAEMVSATRVPNRVAVSSATGSRGVSRVLGSIDHTNCSVPSKLPAFPAGGRLLVPRR